MFEKKYLGKYLDFASRGIVLAALFVSMIIIIFVFQNLPYIGDNLIDTQLGYDHAKVMALMENYGADGRLFYAFASPTLDTLFPLVFTTLYAGAICALLPMQRLWPLVWLPIAGGIFDLIENAQIVAMLVQYPEISPEQVAVASATTWIKFGLIWTSLLLIAIFGAVKLTRWTMNRLRQE